jgi:hypothetical protein
VVEIAGEGAAAARLLVELDVWDFDGLADAGARLARR